MKRILALAVLLTGLSLALSASAAPNATLMIQHVTKGCHSWSLNGGKLQVVQRVDLSAGGSLLVVNNDVMPHQLVQTAGKPAAIKLVSSGMMKSGVLAKGRGMMSHMGATVKVTFPAKGTYTFTTKAGEDYMKGIVTTGEDHVLKAIVTVS